jgi:hypothetical protein
LKFRANLEYQGCLEFHILHARKISASSQFLAERYGILVTLGLLSNSPDSKAIFEFSGMIALALSLS